MLRFGEIPLVLAYQIFSPRWSIKQDELVHSAEVLAKYWKLDSHALVDQLRAAFAIHDTVMSQDDSLKTARSRELWLRVLTHMSEDDASVSLSRQVIASFLVIQPQSAACERAFASVEGLRDHLGADTTVPLLEQELIITSWGKHLMCAAKSGFLKRCCQKFGGKERRASSRQHYFRKGRLVQRVRAPRSDRGRQRPHYKRHKKVAQLVEAPNARLLVYSEKASVHMEVAEGDVQLSSIYDPLSPPVRVKRRLKAAEQDEA